MRNLFVDEIYKMMGEDSGIVFLTAECGFNVVEKIERKYPERFFNTGIAEQSLVGTAAGVSLRGLRPVAYTMAMFLAMRAYEQIRDDVAYQNLPVVLAGVIPGLGYGNSGTTHHAVEDTALMRILPNMTVVYPSCETDVRTLTRKIFQRNTPCYIGLARASADYQPNYDAGAIEIGKAIQLTPGRDAALFAFGSMIPAAVRAADILKKDGIGLSVYNMHTVKPLDAEAVRKAAKECGLIFTLEEENVLGGLGGAVAEILAEEKNVSCQLKRLGIPDEYCDVNGTQSWLHVHYGIDAQGVAAAVREKLK
ncbi:MAG: transketolase [Oscillospiraceae bacterium]|jgi:transketolase|nr:transketolase [Oscillospiraceae bacterium]